MAISKKILNKYLVIFLVLQPFIDLFTSLVINFWEFDISLGMITRFLFMAFAVIYLLFYSNFPYKRNVMIYIGIIILYSILYLINNLAARGTIVLFSETKYLLKIFYFPIVLLFFVNLLKEKKFDIKSDSIVYIIFSYIFIIFLAQITGTQFVSYSSDKLGHVGWFYSPNEISAILAMLSPIIIYNVIGNRKKIYYSILTVIYVYAMFLIGTKVPALGIAITVLGFIFIYFMQIILEHKKSVGILLYPLIPIALFIVLIFPLTPVGYNMNIHLSWLKVDNVKDLYKPGNSSKLANVIFNDREKHSVDAREKFNKAPVQDKLLGIGYIDKTGESNSLIEMDYHDIFYHNGIIGFIIYFSPLFLLLINIVKKLILNIQMVFTNAELAQYIMGLLLALGVAYFAGHVLVAPAVSIYIAFISTKLMEQLK